MRPADEVILKVGRHSGLRLSPSLRAAASLEKRYGFQTLLSAIADSNLTVVRDVIETSSDCPDFLALLDGIPLIDVIPNVLEPLQAHVLALAGVNPDNDAPANSESMSYAEYHKRLYQIGTGWLGWSPEVTWQATADEITDAYEGHVEMLRAIYGGKEEETKTTETVSPAKATFDRAGFERLRGMAKVV